MGYTTDFYGQIDVEPPMSAKLVATLKEYSETRHNPDICPGYNCDWIPTDDGRGIKWNGVEKFYNSVEWMQWIIDRFLAPRGHICNGVINAEGESSGDVWRLVVENNKVRKQEAKL